MYSGGDECWNGPNRVVRMRMVCGAEDALIDVKENGKCTYEFTFASPAACSKKYLLLYIIFCYIFGNLKNGFDDKRHADKLKKYIKKISPPEQDIVHDEL